MSRPKRVCAQRASASFLEEQTSVLYWTEQRNLKKAFQASLVEFRRKERLAEKQKQQPKQGNFSGNCAINSTGNSPPTKSSLESGKQQKDASVQTNDSEDESHASDNGKRNSVNHEDDSDLDTRKKPRISAQKSPLMSRPKRVCAQRASEQTSVLYWTEQRHLRKDVQSSLSDLRRKERQQEQKQVNVSANSTTNSTSNSPASASKSKGKNGRQKESRVTTNASETKIPAVNNGKRNRVNHEDDSDSDEVKKPPTPVQKSSLMSRPKRVCAQRATEQTSVLYWTEQRNLKKDIQTSLNESKRKDRLAEKQQQQRKQGNSPGSSTTNFTNCSPSSAGKYKGKSSKSSKQQKESSVTTNGRKQSSPATDNSKRNSVDLEVDTEMDGAKTPPIAAQKSSLTMSRPKRVCAQRASASFLEEQTSVLYWTEQRNLKKAYQASLVDFRRKKRLAEKQQQQQQKQENSSTNVFTNATGNSPQSASKTKGKSGKVGKQQRDSTNSSSEHQSFVSERSKRNSVDDEDHTKHPHPAIDGGKRNSVDHEDDVKQSSGTGCNKGNRIEYEDDSETNGTKKPRIPAQRKFAQGASSTTPVSTPVKTSPVAPTLTTELFKGQKPATEDFLTYLCLRNTDLLPPSLDFEAQARTLSNGQEATCKSPVSASSVTS